MVETAVPRTRQEKPHRNTNTRDALSRWLGHPLAYLLTIAILLLAFGWTFVDNPERGAPTRDPAFYTWRTAALLSEDPETLLEVTGPLGLFSGGYRVSPPIIGGFLSSVAGMAPRSAVALIMVGLPALTAALLAGLAFRYRRDPLLWHAVAYGSAGMLLTPPFVGYLDNVLCLFFLGAALWFLEPARTSLAGRVGLGFFLLLAGLTHPTTLSIFGLTLAAMTAVYFLFVTGGVRERLRAALRRDAPILGVALVAAAVVYAVWKVGIWGEPVSLSESALLFPYDRDFFMDRMGEWVSAMRPALNGPLFVIGLVALVAAGRRWVQDDLARVSVMWLAPLVGSFGFLLGLTYPYYRFFNTTLAWVLLVGLGAYVAMRFFIERSRAGGVYRLSLLGVAAVIFILATNFTTGFDLSGWNDPARGWLPADRRENLDRLRGAIGENVDPERPVVFVIDDRPPTSLAQIWGLTQVYGNTSRYALPRGGIDLGFVYQGSLERFLDDKPTLTENSAYNRMARASLADAREGIVRAGAEPLVVVAEIFNPAGANAAIAANDEPVPPSATEVWVLGDEGGITRWVDGEPAALDVPPPPEGEEGGFLHVLRVLAGVAALLIPGFLALRWFLPDAGLAESAGLGAALSLGAAVLLGTVALGLLREPLSEALAWACLAAAVAMGAVLLMREVFRGRARVPAS
jgi:hypothetical protein